eukprot:Filipodium_phascolosomae@DN7152_c0_g1_i1.p1
MSICLKGRSLLTLFDFSKEEIEHLLVLAKNLKQKKKEGSKGSLLEGKNIVMIFDKDSTRTRISFEVATHDEGANVTNLQGSHCGTKESWEDTAKVLGRVYDGIEFRGHHQSVAETIAKFSGIPVWNGLTNEFHPTQVLADLLTLREHVHKDFNEMKLVYVGDARNNMCHSLIIGCAKMGCNFACVSPAKVQPSQELVEKCKKIATKKDWSFAATTKFDDAIVGADAVYTDVWVSMGESDLFSERIELLRDYTVTMDVMKKTGNPEVIFMHCLPSFHDFETTTAQKLRDTYGVHDFEVTDEVFRSKHSVVFDQAENRMHTIKSVMCATIAGA